MSEVKLGVCYKHKTVEWQGCYTICGICKAALHYVTVEEAERISGKQRPEWWKPEAVIGYRPEDQAPPGGLVDHLQGDK